LGSKHSGHGGYSPTWSRNCTRTSISFDVGLAIGAAWGGSCWGWSSGWGNNNIHINYNNSHVSHYNRTHVDRARNRPGSRRNQWRHNPEDRGGAPNAGRKTAQQCGGAARGDQAPPAGCGSPVTGAKAPEISATAAWEREELPTSEWAAIVRSNALVLNAGSSSLKFCVYSRSELESWHLESRARSKVSGVHPEFPQGMQRVESSSIRSSMRACATPSIHSRHWRRGSVSCTATVK
jgi:hypothetical protein